MPEQENPRNDIGELRTRIIYGLVEWVTFLGYAGVGLYFAFVERDIVSGGIFVAGGVGFTGLLEHKKNKYESKKAQETIDNLFPLIEPKEN